MYVHHLLECTFASVLLFPLYIKFPDLIYTWEANDLFNRTNPLQRIMMDSVKKITDLQNSAQPWIKTITVTEKHMPFQSPKTPTKIQKFILMDDVGAKVEGIMFIKGCQTMGSRLQLHHRYRISNADIRHIDKKYIQGSIDLQWAIDRATVIEDVEDGHEMEPFQPSYMEFSKIPECYAKSEGPIDIIGIVVASQPSQTVTTTKGQRVVKKFTLFNSSFEAITLSLWGEFVNVEGAALVRMARQYPVLIATCVNITFFNGLELSTNYRTNLLIDASNDHTLKLKDWATENQKKISEIVNSNMHGFHVVSIPLNDSTNFTTLHNILPDQKVACSKVFISLKNFVQKYFYMACKKCFSATTAAYESEFTCNACSYKQLAEPRCHYEAHLSDTSGTITASLFGPVAEAVLGLSSKQAMAGVAQEYIQQRDVVLSQKKYIVQISIPKLKENEITPRYTVANCVADETSGMMNQETPSESSLGNSLTSVTEGTSTLTSIKDSILPLQVTLPVPSMSQQESATIKSPITETEAVEVPVEAIKYVKGSTKNKSKASLLGKETDLDTVVPEAKRRKN